MNTNLKNALISMAKFVADKAGLIALSDFNKEVTHDLWVQKVAALAALEYTEFSLELTRGEIIEAREAIEGYTGEYIRMPVRYWTMLILQQAYACKGLSIAKAVRVMYVAKIAKPWHSAEALQSLINLNDLDDSRACGVKECRKMTRQIARSQAIREGGLKAIREGGDVYDMMRGIVNAWADENAYRPIAPAVEAAMKTNFAKVVGLK